MDPGSWHELDEARRTASQRRLEEETRRRRWLDGLKEGDEVAVRARPGMDGISVTFQRLTKAQKKFLFVGAAKYRRQDGDQVRKPGSDRWSSRPWLEEATDALKQEVAHHARAREVRYELEALARASLAKLPREVLEELYKAAKAAADHEVWKKP